MNEDRETNKTKGADISIEFEKYCGVLFDEKMR